MRTMVTIWHSPESHEVITTVDCGPGSISFEWLEDGELLIVGRLINMSYKHVLDFDVRRMKAVSP